MIDPTSVSDALNEHFSEIRPDEFAQRLRANSAGAPLEKSELMDGSEMSDLILFQPAPNRLPLDAYLASALTGLDENQRQLVFHLSDTISVVCEQVGIALYEPRKNTDPVHHAHVSDTEVFSTDRERVVSSDLVIHLSHFASTGAGEELDFAFNALVPLIIVRHSSTKVSRMVTGIPTLKLEISYSDPEDLRIELRERLDEVRPVLEARKLAFAEYDANVVGNNIRLIREARGLTRNDVADRIPHLTVDSLALIEEGTDRTANPSLIQLRQIAAVLSTTVADFVEPDLSERLLALLNEWVSGRTAARFPDVSARDRAKILRRVLYRFLDSLEGE